MKNIKKIFKLVQEREMYPYEEDNFRLLISEIAFSLLAMAVVTLAYFSLQKVFI